MLLSILVNALSHTTKTTSTIHIALPLTLITQAIKRIIIIAHFPPTISWIPFTRTFSLHHKTLSTSRSFSRGRTGSLELPPTGTAANSPESLNTLPSDRKETAQTESVQQNYAHSQDHNKPSEIDWLADSHLIPVIATFFERLHPILPIFTRSWILDRIDKDEHRSRPSFAAMLLALSSLVKIQPVKAVDRVSRSQRNSQARALLEQSVRIRASVLMGQSQSLDEVLASFYSFATLFGMQEHDAATFRLRESVILAQLMKLNLHESYMFLDPKEQERRLRTYWLLCITER